MSYQVTYVGPSNFRIIGPVEFERMGVGNKEEMIFERGIPSDVTDNFAGALIETDIFPGEFQITAYDEDDPADEEGLDDETNDGDDE